MAIVETISAGSNVGTNVSASRDDQCRQQCWYNRFGKSERSVLTGMLVQTVSADSLGTQQCGPASEFDQRWLGTLGGNLEARSGSNV